MKRNFCSVWTVVIALMMLGSLYPSAWAGQWYVDRIECEVFREWHAINKIGTVVLNERHVGGPNLASVAWAHHGISNVSANGYNQRLQPPTPRVSLSTPRYDSSTFLGGHSASAEFPPITVRVTVTPIYKWIGEDTPSTQFYVIERGRCAVGETKEEYPNLYSQANPFGGQVQILEADNGFADSLTELASLDPYITHFYSIDKWHVSKIETMNAREVSGPSRTLKAAISGHSFTLGHPSDVHSPSQSLCSKRVMSKTIVYGTSL